MSNFPIIPNGYKTTAGTPVKYEGGIDSSWSPDWSMSDDGKGLLTGSLKFFYNCPQNKPKTSIVKKGSSHPLYAKLLCNSVTQTFQSNDILYVEASYVGLDQDPAGIDWSLNTPTEEESIANHPDFGDPAKGWNVVTKSGFDPETGLPYWNTKTVVVDEEGVFEKFRYTEENRKNGFAGVTSYKACRATVSVTQYTANTALVSSSLDALGKIASPSVSVPYATKEQQNWLCTSVSVTQYSDTIFQISQEFTLSGLKGWSNKLYQSAS